MFNDILAKYLLLFDSGAFGAECSWTEAEDSLDGFIIITHLLQDEEGDAGRG
jgi:hypothetical protein